MSVMKLLLFKYGIIGVVNLFLFIAGISCKKEDDENAVTKPNKAPLSNAGSNQTISLPKDYVTLDGSGSIDTENNINKTEWRKISGPSSFTILNASSIKTTVSELIEGVYAFELKVTDSYGLISRDTTIITVLGCFREYDLEVTTSCGYLYNDNTEYCDDYPYNSCSFYDELYIVGYASVPSIGELQIDIYEQVDTALSDHILYSSAGISQLDQSSERRYLFGPISGMKIVELIKKGGGSFSGTSQLAGGSAQNCIPTLFDNKSPLSITGTIDTTYRTVSLRVVGKIYL